MKLDFLNDVFVIRKEMGRAICAPRLSIALKPCSSNIESSLDTSIHLEVYMNIDDFRITVFRNLALFSSSPDAKPLAAISIKDFEGLFHLFLKDFLYSFQTYTEVTGEDLLTYPDAQNNTLITNLNKANV